MNESRRAVAHVPGVRVYCTGCGAVREGKRLFLCRVVVVLWLGRCGGLTRKVGCLPTLRGWTSRSRRTNHLDRPPRRPCRESPGLFVLSLSHSLECSRKWVVNPPARLRGSRGGGLFSAPERAPPRLIKGLEAFPLSKLRWSREEPVS